VASGAAGVARGARLGPSGQGHGCVCGQEFEVWARLEGVNMNGCVIYGHSMEDDFMNMNDHEESE